MTEPTEQTASDSSIDDLRRIREQFAHESGGDIRRHVEQTQAAFQELQTQLQLPTVAPASTAPSDR